MRKGNQDSDMFCNFYSTCISLQNFIYLIQLLQFSGHQAYQKQGRVVENKIINLGEKEWEDKWKLAVKYMTFDVILTPQH